jgi:hypothetical protein
MMTMSIGLRIGIGCAAVIGGLRLWGLVAGEAADRADRPISRQADSGRGIRFPRVVSYADVRIGDPTVSYKDQEFLIDAQLVVWQDGDEGIWVCRFDSLAGNLDPPDGRGRFIGVGAPLLTPDEFLKSVINGPEFGFSRRGLSVYFCSGDDPPNYEIARVDLADGIQEILAPGRTNGVRGALPTQDPTLPDCRILYGRREEYEDGSSEVISEWFDEGDPTTLSPFPKSANGSTGPHWIPNRRAIITNVADIDGIPQIATYDIDSQATTFLTAGPQAKIDAIAFEAPEFRGEQVFVCTVDDQSVAVFRRNQPMWSCIRRIRPPGAADAEIPPTVSSAEPVIYRGETFFTYVANYADGTSRICLASLDRGINTWVSAPSELRQLDPEGVAIGDRLFVYYWTNRNADGVNELHRSQVMLWP